MSFIKRLLFLSVVNFIDQTISNFLSEFFIIIPLTFLSYWFYVYRSDKNISALEAFLLGLFFDLISGSYFGLNTIFFCLVAYYLNSNVNSFKLFSYLQVCIFFGLSASAYVGFTQLVLNLYNFSYLTLFLSSIVNIIFCFIIAFIAAYFPKSINMKL